MRVIRSWAMVISVVVAVGCGSSPGTGQGGSSGGTAGSGGHAGSSSSGGGGAGQSCNACVELSDPFGAAGTPCHDSLGACQAAPACSAWLGCTDKCVEHEYTAACFAACDAASASAKSLYEAMYGCVCAACAPACSAACM